MSSNHLPSISIVITAYNTGDFLRECLKSVFQEIEHIKSKVIAYEIIVIDNGSTDNLLLHIDGYISYISFFRLEKNTGRAAAKNFGLSCAQYTIISFLDSDDICASKRYLSLLEPFSKDPKLDCVIGNVLNFSDSYKLHYSEITDGMIPGNMAIKKESLERVGLFDTNYKACDFADWYSRFANTSLSCAHVKKLVLHRRVHKTNSSVSHKNEYWNELFYVLRNRISIANGAA